MIAGLIATDAAIIAGGDYDPEDLNCNENAQENENAYWSCMGSEDWETIEWNAAQIRYNYPVFQVTVSGGGWFWGALLSYKKAFRASNDELYGMVGMGWMQNLENNCDFGQPGCCGMDLSGEFEGCNS